MKRSQIRMCLHAIRNYRQDHPYESLKQNQKKRKNCLFSNCEGKCERNGLKADEKIRNVQFDPEQTHRIDHNFSSQSERKNLSSLQKIKNYVRQTSSLFEQFCHEKEKNVQRWSSLSQKSYNLHEIKLKDGYEHQPRILSQKTNKQRVIVDCSHNLIKKKKNSASNIKNKKVVYPKNDKKFSTEKKGTQRQCRISPWENTDFQEKYFEFFI